MDLTFWHRKWQVNEIGFHLEDVNPMLLAHAASLGLQPGQRWFLPLCGKTRDIGWLLDQGFAVVGAELSGLAVDQLFADLGITPDIAEYEEMQCYQAPGLDIFVGDVFYLSENLLGPVDGVYDRAALVALPPSMRPGYARHIHAVTAGAPQLLITFDYDQNQMSGPPFCVNEAEVRQLYGAEYNIQLLQQQEVIGGLKGLCAADELVFNLRRH
ncbi:MAG: thiopurine S-methyltransferase [Pseudomonadales bacterium]|nr:thiopurine S-methyltransferase [Pseudomonadales bacterium]